MERQLACRVLLLSFFCMVQTRRSPSLLSGKGDQICLFLFALNDPHTIACNVYMQMSMISAALWSAEIAWQTSVLGQRHCMKAALYPLAFASGASPIVCRCSKTRIIGATPLQILAYAQNLLNRQKVGVVSGSRELVLSFVILHTSLVFHAGSQVSNPGSFTDYLHLHFVVVNLTNFQQYDIRQRLWKTIYT